ncbi:MAG: hypothetical protein AAB449_00660 [Patescibacteria group bacterium]
MNNKKPMSIPRHRKHEAQQHNVVPRLEGIVKNKGIKPVRKKRGLSSKLKKEAEHYAEEQLETPESLVL